MTALTACGTVAAPATAEPAHSARAAPTATATPTPKPTEPFLVVLGQTAASPDRQDILTILDASGVEHARVTFDPPVVPATPMATTSVQQPATAAAGRAFYMDSTGTVHAIAPDGTPTDVARFPVAAGEEISFAVNPDGTEVIAVVNSGPGFRQFSVYSAATGGATRLVHGPAASRGIVRLLTWSAAGPVAITDALAAFQGCEAGECSPWGHAAILDPASGTVGLPVGGADCLLWNIAGSSALCSVGIPTNDGAAATGISSRKLDGSGGKPVPVTSYCSCFYDARLSPAGDVALLVSTTPGELASVIVRPDGTKSTVAVPAVTSGLGVLSAYTWWGNHTLVGVTTCGSIGCTQEGGAVATVDRTDPALHTFPLNHGGDPLATLIA